MSWTPGPLKYWLDINDSGTWGDDPTDVEGIPTVRSTDISLDGNWSLDAVALRSLPASDLRSKRLHRGDLVVVKSSGSAEHLGKTAIVTEQVESMGACFANFVQRLRPSSRAEPRFVWYLLNSSRAAAEMEVLGNTTTGLRNLSGSIVGSVTFPGPPLAEQRAIAEFLDTETARIDALITKKRRMIDLLEERMRSASALWRSNLEHNHGVTTLRRWTDLVEQGWSPVCESTPAEASEWGVLKTSAVSRGVFNPTENKKLPADTAPERRWQVREGDLLITRGSGSPGSVAVACVARPAGRLLTISDLIYRVHLNGASDSEFVAAMLRTPQARSEIEASIRTDAGQTLKVRADDIKSLTVPRVPLNEQKRARFRWSSYESAALSAIVRLRDQITLLQEHRQTLITAAVTGELDVPGVAV